MNNDIRAGKFTSSEIVALTKLGKDKVSFGAPAMTYISETNMERRLGRSLEVEENARPLTWGKLVEQRAFELLGLEYSLVSDSTLIHPEYPFWVGTPDGEKKKDNTIIDIKCPITLKSFCQLVDPLYNGLTGMDAMNAIRENHKDGDKYYWQLVSNACLKGSDYAELIVYMPYASELDEIRTLAQNVPSDLLSKHYWIAMALPDDLPYLLVGGYYKNLNIIRFEVPESDKDFLTAQVEKASELLVSTDPKELAW